MVQVSGAQVSRRVSTAAIAAMLAESAWSPAVGGDNRQKKRRKKVSKVSGGTEKRRVFDRESAEALPAGHPVSWKALWGSDLAPVFPQLLPMGARGTEGVH